MDIGFIGLGNMGYPMARRLVEAGHKLVVYDDGSEDGTLEFLREAVDDAPVTAELRLSDLRSPPAIMNHYLATTEAGMFAKIDNDIALPGGWLNTMRNVLKNHPAVEVLGMEAGMEVMMEVVVLEEAMEEAMGEGHSDNSV